jgi:DNA repair protein RecO (recombination protein O)
MVRSFTYSALVLRVRPSGDANREAYFLTAEEGLLRATVFGGPKSRLRAHVSPFHRGTLWIYHDPVRDSRKVTDFDVQSWKPGIRELYERSAAAAAIAETILAAHGGGGSWVEALTLADGALAALEEADESCCTRIFIHFLWNWLDLLGLRPEPNRCASCACEAAGDGLLWYSRREGVLLCPSCAGFSGHAERSAPSSARPEDLLPLGPGLRRWLGAVQDLRPSLLGRYTLDQASLGQGKILVTELLAAALGRRLVSWEWKTG